MTQHLNRRAALAGLILVPVAGLSTVALAAPLSAADKALVNKAVAYLQGLGVNNVAQASAVAGNTAAPTPVAGEP